MNHFETNSLMNMANLLSKAKKTVTIEQYKQFKKVCQDHGLKMQDVLNQFIDWFGKEGTSENNHIKRTADCELKR